MNPTARPPAFVAVVRTDFLALAGSILPPVGAAIAIAGAMGILPDRHRSLAQGELVTASTMPVGGATLFALAFAVTGAVLVAWRLRKIQSVFASGLRVPGRIVDLRPFKDRAWVRYAYVVQGNEQDVRHFVHQSAAFKRLEVGQAVTIAVDPRRPRDGFVTALFE